MFSIAKSVFALLAGVALLLVGTGLLHTLLAVRAEIEGYGQIAIGVMTSAYFVGFLSGTFLAPRMIRRVGHIRSFSIYAAVASVAALLHGLLIEPLTWMLLRAIAGACVVGLYTTVESWLNALSTHANRGRIFALYMFVNLGALVFGQAVILIAPTTGFTLFALISVSITLSLVPVGLTRLHQPPISPIPEISIQGLFSKAPAALIGAAASGLGMAAFWGLAPVLAHHLDFGREGVAAFMATIIIGGALLQWPIGYFSDKRGRALTIALSSLSAAVLALLMWWSMHTGLTALLFVSLFFYGGFAFSIYPLSMTYMMDSLPNGAVLEGTMGVLVAHGAAAAFGPLIAGTVMQTYGSFALSGYFAVVWLLLFIGVVVIMLSRHVTAEPSAAFRPMVRTAPAALELMPETQAQTPAETQRNE